MYDRRLEISFREAEAEGGGSVIELNDDTAGVRVTPDLAQKIADILDSRRDGEVVVKWNGREFVPGGDPYAARDTETSAPEMFMPDNDNNHKRPESLKNYIHTILNGTQDEKNNLSNRHFYLTETPQF
ncbi:MAG: hypothetical protein LBD13_00895, partial [Spirochaetaceae bacterium]|nr:hypothetical protein [Spirochaetaceae bacterium]